MNVIRGQYSLEYEVGVHWRYLTLLVAIESGEKGKYLAGVIMRVKTYALRMGLFLHFSLYCIVSKR